MDASAFRHIGEVLDKSFNRMMWWAMFGMVSAGLLGVTVVGFGIWWAVHHIAFV